MSFEVQNSNALNKILFLEKYLEKQSKEDMKEGTGIAEGKTSEDDLVEIAAEFDECKDSSKMKTSVSNVHSMADLDGDGKISNDEIAKFKGILEKVGISSSEMLALFEKYDNEVSEDVNYIDTNEIKDTNLEAFKEAISKYPKLSEMIEEIGYEEFFNLLDKNHDGKLNNDETNEDTGNLSYSDVKSILEENDHTPTDPKESVDKQVSDIEDEQELFQRLREALGIDTPQGETSLAPDSSMQNAAPSYSVPSGGYSAPSSGGYSVPSSGGYSAPSSGGTSTSTASGNAATNNTTTKNGDIDAQIKELEDKKTTEQSNLDEHNSDLSAVMDGSDSEISDLKEDMEDKKEEYDKALEKDAEDNPKIKALQEEKEENEKSIEENENKTKEAEENLNETKNSISEQKNVISGLKSEKTALEAALKNVSSTKETKANKDELAAKKSELSGKISDLEEKISAEEEKLSALEEDEKKYEEELKDLETEKKELEDTRDEIEKNIEKEASNAVKEALSAYQEARDSFESTKEARLETVKGEIETSRTEISNLETQIQELEAKKIEEENQISPFGQYNAQKGEALADAANSLYGGVSKGGGLCATGVSQAINKALGYATHGNGCDYGNVLSQRDDWVEITDSITVDDLKSLPAGAIVSWSPYNTSSLGRLYGHVYICDGKGNEISDFKSNITSYYADRGSKFRAFLPK